MNVSFAPIKTQARKFMRKSVLFPAGIALLAGGMAISQLPATKEYQQKRYDAKLAEAKEWYYDVYLNNPESNVDSQLKDILTMINNPHLTKDEVIMDKYENRHKDKLIGDIQSAKEKYITPALEKTGEFCDELAEKAEEKTNEAKSLATEHSPACWGTLAALGLLGTGAGMYRANRKEETNSENKETYNTTL